MNGRLSNFAESTQVAEKSGAVRFLLLIAGLGGLIYGIDIGIIAVRCPIYRPPPKAPGDSTLSKFRSSSPQCCWEAFCHRSLPACWPIC